MDRYFGPATKIQIALNGEWEAAASLERSQSRSALIKKWSEARAERAFEIFYEDTGYGNAFMGGVVDPLSSDDCVDCVAMLSESRSISEALANYASWMRGSFARGPDMAELGVVNLWRSRGPIRVWTNGECLPTVPAIRAALDSSSWPSDQRRDTVALELGWTRPYRHWIGLPSTKTTPSGNLSDPMLAAYWCVVGVGDARSSGPELGVRHGDRG